MYYYYHHDYELKSFNSRIFFILGKRKLYPWARGLGLSKGAADKLSKGFTPGGKILDAICRHENLNLSWLVSNRGHPFAVNPFYTDRAFAEYIANLTPKSEFYLSKYKGSLVLITAFTNTYDYRGEQVVFRDIRTAIGPIGHFVSGTLSEQYQHNASTDETAPKWYKFQFPNEELEQIIHGWLSPGQLFANNLEDFQLTKIKSTAELSQFLNQQKTEERIVIKSIPLSGKIPEPTSS